MIMSVLRAFLCPVVAYRWKHQGCVGCLSMQHLSYVG